jgi:PAS domain S-box-containing protein
MAALACASESNLQRLKVLLRSGLGIIFFLEVVRWLEVVRLEPTLLHGARLFFVFDLTLVSAALYLTYRQFGHHWRGATMLFCLILLASRTLSAIAINQDEPLMLALFLFVLGTAVLVPWSVRCQGVVTLASLVAFAIAAVEGDVAPDSVQRWLVLAATMAFGLSFTALKDQYRRQALLIDELLDRENRLTKSQAVLRTLFDAVPDIVTLTRFSDGKLFEVNDEFLRRTGFNREQDFTTSVTRASAWVRPQERDKYIQELKETGRVRNLEVDFRLNGSVARYLMSSVSVELDGEVYALNVARDATELQKHKRTLYEAQERLSAQVQELTATQKRLCGSEAIIRRLFDAVPDLVTVTRLADGKFIEVNAEFLRRTGLTREKALSTSTIEIGQWVRPEERNAFRQKLRTDGHVREFEVDFLLQGAVVPYLASSVVVELDGEACALGVGHDITRIKETERALREVQERLSTQVEELTSTQGRLRAEVAEREAAERVAHERETTLRKLFEASPDIITVSSRRDFRLIQANNAFFHETGYAPQEVIGQQIYLKFWTDPVQREQLKQRLDRDGFAHNMEADLTMKDGTVNSYLLSTVVVELDGEPCRVSFWRNVTEAKRTAQRVADSEAMLRSMFDAIPDIVITRRGDVVGDVNEEFVKRAGVSRAQVLGRRVEEATLFLRSEDRAEFLRRVRADGIVRNFQADLKIKGSAVPYLVSGAMIETADGPLLFSISRDISSRIQMEQELIAAREAALAASRAKSEFLSSMSHEIRTPMNAILGMAELLSETELDSEQRRFLGVINANSASLLELINSILDLAKIESGRLQIEETEFELTDVVDKTIATFQVRAHSKGLELAARIVPGTPEYLVGDPLRLRQILINLIGNALKFTEVGEVVLLIENDAEADESGYLRFTVSDTGIGLPPDKLDSIFSSFTQADPSTSRKYGGTGLGLSISQRLTMLMGGRIWVESELGKGSKFIFTLPFGLASRVDITTKVALPELTGLRVLVVDDNATNRLIAR